MSKVEELLFELGRPKGKPVVIAKLQELVLRRDGPKDLDEVEAVLAVVGPLVFTDTVETKKAIIGFIEDLCRYCPEKFGDITSFILVLLSDESPIVLKRVLQGFCQMIKHVMMFLAFTKNLDIDKTIRDWDSMKQAINKTMSLDSKNEGVLTMAVRYWQNIVELHSMSAAEKQSPNALLKEFPTIYSSQEEIVDIAKKALQNLLDYFESDTIVSSQLIACLGSLKAIACSRDWTTNTILVAMHHRNENLPPTLSKSNRTNFEKHLKVQVKAMAKEPKVCEKAGDILENLLRDLGEDSKLLMQTIKRFKADDNRVIRQPDPQPIEMDYDLKRKSKRNFLVDNEMDVDSQDVELADEMSTIKSAQVKKQAVEQQLQPYLNQIQSVADLVLAHLSLIPDDKVDTIVDGIISLGQARPLTELVLRQLVDVPSDQDGLEALKRAEAQKKLRKAAEQNRKILIMKQKAKELHLQEITKPLSKGTKEKLMIGATNRILASEKNCLIAGASLQRKKIITVMATTYPPYVRSLIIEHIKQDLRGRIELAMSIFYEEYAIMKGFCLPSAIKSEHPPEHQFNELFLALVQQITEMKDQKERLELLTMLYTEVPMLTAEAIAFLDNLCIMEDWLEPSMNLIKTLAVKRVADRVACLQVLLKYSMHGNSDIRGMAVTNIMDMFVRYELLFDTIILSAKECLKYLRNKMPPMGLFSSVLGRSESSNWNEDLVKTCLGLSLQLLPLEQGLMDDFSKVFADANIDIRRTMLTTIAGPVELMGSDSPAILHFIEHCPKECLILAAKIILVLAEKCDSKLCEKFIEEVRALYDKEKDVRLIIPIVNSISKAEIIEALPSFLKMAPALVREIFSRLLGTGKYKYDSGNRQITPTEVLVALHTENIQKAGLKQVVLATSICIAEKEVYTQDVLAAVLQQLVDMQPMPTLLMRTVIQSLALYPDLTKFICGLLQRLIQAKVWQHKMVWDGFLKCCQRLQAQSFPILLQLPPQQLQDALEKCNDLQESLKEHAVELNTSQAGSVPLQTMDVLLKSAEDKVKEESRVKQPLPPGDE